MQWRNSQIYCKLVVGLSLVSGNLSLFQRSFASSGYSTAPNCFDMKFEYFEVLEIAQSSLIVQEKLSQCTLLQSRQADSWNDEFLKLSTNIIKKAKMHSHQLPIEIFCRNLSIMHLLLTWSIVKCWLICKFRDFQVIPFPQSRRISLRINAEDYFSLKCFSSFSLGDPPVIKNADLYMRMYTIL